MRRPLLACLAVTLLLGCERQVLVFGDSNTCFRRPCDDEAKWPAELRRLAHQAGLRVRVDAWGEAGVTVGAYRNRQGEPTQTYRGNPTLATWHLERMIAGTDLGSACTLLRSFNPPAIVIAVGTNDILGGHPSWIIADEILALTRRLEQTAPCAHVYVALLPPLHVPSVRGTDVLIVNAHMRQKVPADRVVDFFTGVTETDLQDGVHLTPAGQAKRAAAAFRALFPGTPSPDRAG